MSRKNIFVFLHCILTFITTDFNYIIGKEYLVRTQENWLDDIIKEAKRFGFEFKEKVISDVYVFVDDGRQVTDVRQRMKDFTGYFNGKIIAMEERKYSIVKFRPLEKEIFPMQQTYFGRLVLRHVNMEKTCWPYYGMDVQNVWKLNITGRGIKVAVVDNGVSHSHPDLVHQVDTKRSRSFVSEHSTDDTMPQRFYSYRDITDKVTSHGTNAAGLIAGTFQNEYCSAGIAYDSVVIALKVFSVEDETPKSIEKWIRDEFPYSDKHIASALEWKRDVIDVYSCSFNRHYTFKQLPLDMKAALQNGIEKGRGGKGSVFVFSSGNSGGPVYDCNIEAFASSDYTITISSVGKDGTVPSYAISCATTLASTYGIYNTHNGTKPLETTLHDSRCTSFEGTSASTALASGVIALVLQANAELTWRCIQHIIVLTSSFDTLSSTEPVQINDAGFRYDHKFGFGLINTKAMVLQAMNWTQVPRQEQIILYEKDISARYVSNNAIAAYLFFGGCKQGEMCLKYVEQVSVTLRYETLNNNQIDIVICSPAKTCSYILNRNVLEIRRQKRENTQNIIRKWTFKSVHFWGENPKGTWIVLLIGNETSVTNSDILDVVNITILGTAAYPYSSETNKRTTRRREQISVKDIEYATTVNDIFNHSLKKPFKGTYINYDNRANKPTLPDKTDIMKENESTDEMQEKQQDASKKSSGAAAYTVGKSESSLVMEKNRVAQLKYITLQRLKHMTAVVGVKLAQTPPTNDTMSRVCVLV